MATGDTNDLAARLRSVLPEPWFPDHAPVLSAVLNGIGGVWSVIFGLYAWLVAQTRIATSTGAMLDLVALDFFQSRLGRRSGEGDPALLTRIRREMFRERGTRHAVIQVLTDLTGKPPTVFEPAYSLDTGGWGAAGAHVGTGLGYGVAGGYGSELLPFQFFVCAKRGSISPIPSVMGYYTGSGWAGGGYGVGAIEYASPAWAQGPVTDADIFAAVASVIPDATIAWTAITN